MECAAREPISRLIFLLGLVFAPGLFAQGYTIAPIPAWAKPATLPVVDRQGLRNNSNGVAYLLIDSQWRVRAGMQSRYRHFAVQALNTSGVGEVSRVSIDFDPTYQSVTLHNIQVYRDGRVDDRMDRVQINLLQREKDLENQIYDGSKTLNVFVEDIRPRDVIEYSYTIEGANPVFDGHFATQLDTRWQVPVGRFHYRVLWASVGHLNVRNVNTDIEPEVTTEDGYTEYVWTQEAVEELVVDANTPDWYDPFPVVYLSDIASWGEVTRWAWPLYRPVVDTPALSRVTARILDRTNTPEQRVLAALRFVQDEIRYLGIEMGDRSQRPNAPDTVIERRFGDCKDKSRLLVSLLRGMGIEASSALVNTRNGMRLKDALPTPTAFNHAIVLARIDAQKYWLDATRTHQSGDLTTLYQPDFDYALVVSQQPHELTRIPDNMNGVHSKVVEEQFDIRGATDKPVSYEIVTNHERFFADSMRKQLSESNPDQLQDAYLKYTAKYYPEVRTTNLLDVRNDEKQNRLTMTERYTIPEFWQVNDDERYVVANFVPFLINDHVNDVQSPIRNAPYAVLHPVRYQHTTRVLVPEGSQFERENFAVEDESFRFVKKVDFTDDILTIDYLYESRSDHVKPEDIKAYSSNVRAAQRQAYYQIQRANPAVNFGQFRFDVGDINWQMVGVVVGAILIVTWLSYRYVYIYDPAYHAPKTVDKRLGGLGGWLLLPAIGLVISPIRILIESAELAFIFSAVQWSMIGDQLGPGFLVMIGLETLLNLVLVVLALALLALFFKRRHTLPRLFIAYQLLALGLVSADLLVVHLLSYPGAEVTAADLGELLRRVFYALIWSWYFVASKRVKATFTRRLGRSESVRYQAADAQDAVVHGVNP